MVLLQAAVKHIRGDVLQMFSDQSADSILANHRRELETQQQEKISQVPKERQNTFSTGIRVVGVCIRIPKPIVHPKKFVIFLAMSAITDFNVDLFEIGLMGVAA